MKRLMFRATLRMLRNHLRDHWASDIAVGLLGLGLAVFGQGDVTESPYTVSGTGTVAIQGSAAIVEAPDFLTSAPSARATSN